MRAKSTALAAGVRPADLLELVKPRITGMVGVMAAAGFILASAEEIAPALFLHTVLGTAILAAGAGVLNQVLERDLDALMRRTANRPLPAGRIDPDTALLWGVALAVCGLFDLALAVNPLTALVGALTLASYLFVYTPLKRVTPVATLVGAAPGAAPPLMGWTGARGEIELGAWVLFALLFLWQLPHFLAIAWLFREDYERAGMPVLPVFDRQGERTGRQVLAWGGALLPVSLMPAALGLAGGAYFVGALALGLTFLGACAAFTLSHSMAAARRLLLVSVLYLPAVLAVLVLDRAAG